MSLLRSLPLCDCSFGQAFFSRIPSDGDIASHTGPTNIKLRLQLPLLLPTSSGFCITGKCAATAARRAAS
jgi:hypothetical protein